MVDPIIPCSKTNMTRYTFEEISSELKNENIFSEKAKRITVVKTVIKTKYFSACLERLTACTRVDSTMNNGERALGVNE
jgi:hypothetical protein